MFQIYLLFLVTVVPEGVRLLYPVEVMDGWTSATAIRAAAACLTALTMTLVTLRKPVQQTAARAKAETRWHQRTAVVSDAGDF